MLLRYGTRDELFKYGVLVITRQNVPSGVVVVLSKIVFCTCTASEPRQQISELSLQRYTSPHPALLHFVESPSDRDPRCRPDSAWGMYAFLECSFMRINPRLWSH